MVGDQDAHDVDGVLALLVKLLRGSETEVIKRWKKFGWCRLYYIEGSPRTNNLLQMRNVKGVQGLP